MSQTAPSASAAPPRWPGGLWRVQLVSGLLLALAVVLQPPAPAFLYDATKYWGGARALLAGGDVFTAGLLDLRGVLTVLLYLPAAAVTAVAGDAAAGFAVLAENALLVAVIGVVLVPRLVAVWRPATRTTVLVAAVGTGITLAGFAPFPLTDLWAAALLITAVVALDRTGRWWLLLAGAAAGVAFNVRPGSLLTLIALGIAVLVARRLAAGWFALGSALALLPQFVLNLRRGATWLPWPEQTGWLTQLQAADAAYLVRYDTVVAGAASPRRFYCSPGMATALDGDTPGSPGELLTTYLAHLPQAMLFSAQKVGAALHWPLSTPYTAPAPGVDGLFALLVTALAVTGSAVVLTRLVRRGARPRLGTVAAALVWAGALVGLVTSSTETRFALLLVLLGVAGSALLATAALGPDRAATPGRAWVAGTVVAVLAVYALGVTGLQHPVAGEVTPEICAAQ
ncbi:hypothetical protein [Blastococcus xanthinilyticus]|uniref:Dolichyl-phosphate-mannose-protein mannosyltransferase n=1 Tax=Blastococcus xanthinilyticus TaxID=1564164 RepID=A0A5S5D581_9ACTN|nr:hypothetical protein [Blastococcus xanthinilyticus]TYP89829.1 hypothetical protein BD833_102306 [Blastococcus xanthinilyticus]